MALLDIFIGVPQSKYASIAVLVALGAVAFAMVFGKEEVPIGQKFLFVLLLFVIALPSVLLSLFQLTCMVTGAGLKNQRWWCGAYAWIGTIFMIIYSVLIVVVAISALVNGTNVASELDNVMLIEAMKVEANKQAREYFQSEMVVEEEQKQMEQPLAIPEMFAPQQDQEQPQQRQLPTDKVQETFATEMVPTPSPPVKKSDAPVEDVTAPAPVAAPGTEKFMNYSAF
jgi:hypothetical protein